MEDIRERLQALADPDYRAFSLRLLPEVQPQSMLGVRLPLLRRMARSMTEGDRLRYLEASGHIYFEEIMLEAMLIGYLKEPLDQVLRRIWLFLPKIENWSVCDSFVSGLKIVKADPEAFWRLLERCLQDGRPYHLRFILVMLLTYYSKQWERAFELMAQIPCNVYYVRMAKAWALSIYFQHAPQQTLDYMAGERVDAATRRAALQKIVESNRTSPEDKAWIRALRRAEQERMHG